MEMGDQLLESIRTQAESFSHPLMMWYEQAKTLLNTTIVYFTKCAQSRGDISYPD